MGGCGPARVCCQKGFEMIPQKPSGAFRLSARAGDRAPFRGLVVCAVMVWAVLSAVSSPAASLCPDVVRIGYLPDWPPYQYVDSEGQPQGLDVEAARRAVSAAGCPLELVAIGWPRVMSLLEKGMVDMVAGISETPERDQIAAFSAPYRREQVGLYVRPGDSRVYPLTGLADIETLRFRLGVTAGAYYGDDFLRLMARPAFRSHVVEVQGADNPGLVVIGRVDGYLLDVISAQAVMQEADPPLVLEQHPGVLIDNGSIHFAYSRVRMSPELVARIDALLPQDGAEEGDKARPSN